MAVEENGRTKLVKLGVTKDGDNPEVIRIMLRVMYQAAEKQLQVEPRDIIYFDVANAARIRGSTSDADLAKTIEIGCKNLAEMC